MLLGDSSEIVFVFSTLSTSLQADTLDHLHLLWKTCRVVKNCRPSVSTFRSRRCIVASSSNRIRACMGLV